MTKTPPKWRYSTTWVNLSLPNGRREIYTIFGIPRQKLSLHYPPQRSYRLWATTILVALCLTACRVGESPSPTPHRIALLPTFTPTMDHPPTATSANESLGITATFTLLPTAAATLQGATRDHISATMTSTPTGTILVEPTTAVTPQLTLQAVPTIPAAMLTPTTLPSLEPTPTLPSLSESRESSLYIVQAGDTLIGIAQRYQTTVAALQIANGLTNDLIYPDQALAIPNESPPIAIAPVVAPPVVALPPVQPLSVLEGDLAAAYPLTLTTERFTLHYAPDPRPAQPPELLVDIIGRALLHHEQMLQVTLAGRFDAYVAGAPFAPPDQSLRGHSYSADRFFVFLDDGSGNLDDLTYLMAHELTHMFVWLIFGRPTDPMLSEGAAVYVGMDFIAHAQHIPLTTFCAAYDQVGALPWISNNLTYKGHMRDLENYYGAGCFVKYLIETYGIERFGRLYPTNDYLGIYGKTLAQLDTEWHVAFAAARPPVPFDASAFVQFVDRLKVAHATLFNTFTGTAEQMTQYRTLDRVRMALLEGRLADVQLYFDQ